MRFQEALKRLAVATCFLLIQTWANAWGVSDFLPGTPTSGKIAKYAFKLKEDFPITSVAVSRDGRFLAASSTQNNSLDIWNIQERRTVRRLKLVAPNPYFHSLAFSPDSKYLALCDGTGALQIYEASSGALDHTQREQGQVLCNSRVAYSDDGAQLAVSGKDFSVLNTRDWTIIKKIDSTWSRGKNLQHFVFLPGTYDLVIGGSDHFPEFAGQRDAPSGGVYWQLAAADLVPQLRVTVYPVARGRTFNSGVNAIAASPNGKLIATGADTGAGIPSQRITDAVKIIDCQSDRVVANPLNGIASGEQEALEFTPDGNFLLTEFNAGGDARLNLIETKTFSIVDSFGVHGRVRDIAAAKRGSVAAAIDKEIIFWQLIN